MTIPFPVLLTIPIPFMILLALLTCYHLTPLLTLLPYLTPSLRKLADLIPHPGRPRNLPREFFNLPPRPEDDASSINNNPEAGTVLGVRGKLMLLLLGQTTVSIGCGWGFLMLQDEGYTAGTAILLTTSVLPLFSTVSVLGLFMASPYQATRYYSVDSNIRRMVLKGGGITHDTLYSRVLPISIVPVVLGSIVSAVIPKRAHLVVLAITGALTGSTLIAAGVSRSCARQHLSQGAIRLRSSSPGLASEATSQEAEVNVLREKDVEDWVSSPGDNSSGMSAFSYSPSFQTPQSKLRAKSQTENGSPTSWLSSPSATPTTIPEWTYSPGDSVTTPASAVTRERSRSPSPIPDIPNLPQPHAEQPQTAKSSATTMYTTSMSTPDSGMRSIGGSVLGEYSPDPFHPMPRNFQSLSSYPISPSQFPVSPENVATQSRTSLVSRALQSAEALAFEPEERTPSTFTLETYHSASDFVTPASKRRPPPPPPMVPDMPLPPTPTFARSETLFDWPGKDSTEMLMGERDWVEVVGGEGVVSEWGKDGMGVGALALITVLVCFALYTPLLISGSSDTTVSLYTVSLCLPSPILAITSYLLRYRPAKPLKKGSTQSISTHRSLALTSESQLSLPMTMSPKLTPPIEKRQSKNPRFGNLLEHKPSITNFGYDRGGRRPHTVHEAAMWDAAAEAKLKKTLARRSGDVWLEEGHAIEGGGFLSRAAEMIKPYPALRVLESLPEQPAALKRLRGGVMSMLGPRRRGGDEEHAMGSVAPAISISSPSKYDRRPISGISTLEAVDGEEIDIDRTMASTEFSAEIQTALYGRMSQSPTFYCGPDQDLYHTDWLTAKVLPSLVPGVTIGPNTRVGPRPSSMETPKDKRASASSSRSRNGRDAAGPSRRTHGSSSSIDWTPQTSRTTTDADFSTPVASLRQRLRHKASFSLPNISPADFTDVRRSVLDCGRDEGVDLPHFPHDLSPVAEEPNSTFGSLALGVIHADRIGLDSMISEDEAMANEMEQVMGMDTPTRAEFVISPPPDSFISRRMSSRASCRSGMSSRIEEVVPPMPDAFKSSSGTEDTLPSSLKAEVNFSRPTPRLHTQPSIPTMSHPHPPPLHNQPSFPSITSVSIAQRTKVTSAHPPLQARTLNNKQSNETLRSQASGISSADDHAHRFEDAVEEYRPSRSELILVKRLKERAAETTKKPTAPMTVNEGGPLRPLRLLSDRQRQQNRMSEPLPLPSKRVSVLADIKRGSSGMDSPERPGPGPTARAQKGGGRLSKKSKTPSGKENVSVHKGSGLSSVSGGGIRV